MPTALQLAEQQQSSAITISSVTPILAAELIILK